MEGKLITKTGRIFPVNLYNKLEAKLKEDKKRGTGSGRTCQRTGYESDQMP